MRRFRQAVKRDISWLLNATNHPADELAEFPAVARSVVNFGLPDVCGRTISTGRIEEIAQWLEQAIEWFEPRILRNTLSVRAITTVSQAEHNTVTLEITGDLWGQPLPEALFIKTDLDLETGQCDLTESANG
jgi:type VI secretion system protein ImpF